MDEDLDIHRMNPISTEVIQSLIIDIRGERVLLDSDVARLYGVDTKRVNEAVKNNPEKFPAGYLLQLSKDEWEVLKSKFSTSIRGGKVKLPFAFPEKGLYMLATILKSAQATSATFAIIDHRRMGVARGSLPMAARRARRVGTSEATFCKDSGTLFHDQGAICRQRRRKTKNPYATKR